MPRRRKIQSFFIVVIDDDRNQFAVEGPMIDDTNLTSRVYDAQQKGRNVRCCLGLGQTREEVIANWQASYRQQLVNRIELSN